MPQERQRAYLQQGYLLKTAPVPDRYRRCNDNSALMTPGERQRRQRLDNLAELLDESIRIPGIGYRIGFDALIGLIPGTGDLAGLVFGTYIVVESARFKVPRSTLLRMTANVILETVIGAIPLIGDVFDATYKCNLRNLRLLHARLTTQESAPRSDRSFFAVLFALPTIGIVSLILLLV
jgi:hypothetical protein